MEGLGSEGFCGFRRRETETKEKSGIELEEVVTP